MIRVVGRPWPWEPGIGCAPAENAHAGALIPKRHVPHGRWDRSFTYHPSHALLFAAAGFAAYRNDPPVSEGLLLADRGLPAPTRSRPRCTGGRTLAGRRRQPRGPGSRAAPRRPVVPALRSRFRRRDDHSGGTGRAGAVAEAPNVHRRPRRQAEPGRAASARPPSAGRSP